MLVLTGIVTQGLMLLQEVSWSSEHTSPRAPGNIRALRSLRAPQWTVSARGKGTGMPEGCAIRMGLGLTKRDHGAHGSPGLTHLLTLILTREEYLHLVSMWASCEQVSCLPAYSGWVCECTCVCVHVHACVRGAWLLAGDHETGTHLPDWAESKACSDHPCPIMALRW